MGCAVSVNGWLPRRCSLASAPVEEHLRAGEECREWLADWDEFVAAKRLGERDPKRGQREGFVRHFD